MTTTTARPRFTGRQRLILLALLGASFMLAADFAILNVALPEVGSGVGMEVSALPWIAAAFALPAAGFTFLFGRMGDLFGRRGIFLAGLVLLAAASLLGGFATSPEILLLARTLQGFATAMSIPSGLALITTTFPEGPLRDRALGLNGALLSGGFTIGALLGGTLVEVLSWRAAFFINVPVAAGVIVLTLALIRESRVTDRPKLDVPGAVTVSAGLLAVVYAIMEWNLLAAIVGVLLLAAFWIIELRSPAPLAPLRILKLPSVKWGNYAGLLIFGMETGLIFLLTLYLQNVLGFSAFVTGLIFGIPGIAAVTAGITAGRFIGRFGSRAVLVAGLTVQALTTLPLVFLGDHPIALAILLPSLFIGFFGHVSAIVAFTVTATSGLPNEDQGLASGLTTMTQQVALTVGIPILSAIAATQSVQTVGISLALLVNVVVTLVSVVFIWFGLRPRSAVSPAGASEPIESGRPLDDVLQP